MSVTVPRKASKRSRAAAIDLVVFDIDGVLTDGTFLIDPSGREWKRFCYRDLDAITAAQRDGLRLALLTAERGPMVKRIAARFKISSCVSGAKDKAAALTGLAREQGVSLTRICYVGDGDRDAPALEMAGIGLAPSNASIAACRAADQVLNSRGGDGAAAEALAWLTRRTRVATSKGITSE